MIGKKEAHAESVGFERGQLAVSGMGILEFITATIAILVTMM
jgi:hypothetical protein